MYAAACVYLFRSQQTPLTHIGALVEERGRNELTDAQGGWTNQLPRYRRWDEDVVPAHSALEASHSKAPKSLYRTVNRQAEQLLINGQGHCPRPCGLVQLHEHSRHLGGYGSHG